MDSADDAVVRPTQPVKPRITRSVRTTVAKRKALQNDAARDVLTEALRLVTIYENAPLRVPLHVRKAFDRLRTAVHNYRDLRTDLDT